MLACSVKICVNMSRWITWAVFIICGNECQRLWSLQCSAFVSPLDYGLKSPSLREPVPVTTLSTMELYWCGGEA